MTDQSSRVRPPEPERERRRPAPRIEPGCFRTRPEVPSAYYRVHVEVAYTEEASVGAIRKALTDCYTEALAELDRRFAPQDDRRQRAGGERR